MVLLPAPSSNPSGVEQWPVDLMPSGSLAFYLPSTSAAGSTDQLLAGKFSGQPVQPESLLVEPTAKQHQRGH